MDDDIEDILYIVGAEATARKIDLHLLFLSRPIWSCRKTPKKFCSFSAGGGNKISCCLAQKVYSISPPPPQNYIFSSAFSFILSLALTLFTAAYVTAFEEMRQALNAAPIRVSFPEGVSLSGLAKLISVTRRVMLDAGSSPYDVCGMVRETFGAVGFPVPSTFPKQIPGQLSLFDRPALH